MKKIIACFVGVRCTSYKFGEKKGLIESDFFLMMKGLHNVYLKKQNKYMSPYYFLFCIQYEFMKKA